MNDFEAPVAPVERTITVGKKTAVYRFTEASSAVLERLFDVTDANGKVDQDKSRGIRFRVVAAIVSRQDGTPITVEEAGQMRMAVVNALYKAANETIGSDQDADAAGKD